jgi:hypothetical protein
MSRYGLARALAELAQNGVVYLIRRGQVTALRTEAYQRLSPAEYADSLVAYDADRARAIAEKQRGAIS